MSSIFWKSSSHLHVNITRILKCYSILQNSVLILEFHFTRTVSVIPLQKRGSITYNGHEQNEFVIQRASAYTSQTDNHIADLTVRETFDFANRCQGSNDAGIYISFLMYNVYLYTFFCIFSFPNLITLFP